VINEFYTSFYCKYDICVLTDHYYDNKTIEIPNEKGELIKYIFETCRYENVYNIEICYIIFCLS